MSDLSPLPVLDLHSEQPPPAWVNVHMWLVITIGVGSVLSLAVTAADRFLLGGRLDRTAQWPYVFVVSLAFFSPVTIFMGLRQWQCVRHRDRSAGRASLGWQIALAVFFAFGVVMNLGEEWTERKAPSPLMLGFCVAILSADAMFAIGIWKTWNWTGRLPRRGDRLID